MKRAFLALVWGISETRLHGPFDNAPDARSWAEDYLSGGSDDSVEHGAVLGPIPCAHLDDEPEVPFALQPNSPKELSDIINTAVEFAVNKASVPVAEAVRELDFAASGWAENLEADGEAHLPNTLIGMFAKAFRPSELMALYEDCVKESDGGPTDLGKLSIIRQAYTQLTGEEL